MSAPWVYSLDNEGPCNGDVIVKTPHGRMVALIFSTGDEAKTLDRAKRFCAAVSPQWCAHCGEAVPEGYGQECASCRVILESAFAEFEASSFNPFPSESA